MNKAKLMAAFLATTGISTPLDDAFNRGETSMKLRWFDRNTIFSRVLDQDEMKVQYPKPIIIQFMSFDGCSTCEHWSPIWNEIAD